MWWKKLLTVVLLMIWSAGWYPAYEWQRNREMAWRQSLAIGGRPMKPWTNQNRIEFGIASLFWPIGLPTIWLASTTWLSEPASW